MPVRSRTNRRHVVNTSLLFCLMNDGCQVALVVNQVLMRFDALAAVV